MKILLTAIFKDDSELFQIEQMLESFSPFVDGFAFALTGTSGKFTKLEKLFKKYKAHYVKVSPQTNPRVYTKENGKWYFTNFAEARNIVFGLADSLEGYDWYTWADKDDLLVAGEELRKVARMALGKFDAVYFTYWYSIKLREDNSFDETCVAIDQLRERLLKPRMFKWVSRLHEIAVPKDDKYKPQVTMYDFNSKEGRNCVWAHMTNNKIAENNLNRNLRILNIQAKEENYKDPRTLFYLAKTYFDFNNREKDLEALKLLDKYRQLSGWAEERANSWEYTANIYGRLNKPQKAIEALFEALKEFPGRHMYHLLLAKYYGDLKLFDKSDYWLEMALKMKKPTTRTTIGNPLETKFLATSLLYNKAIRESKIDDAIKWLKARNNIAGIKDDGMIKTLEEAKWLNQAGIWTWNLAKWLKDTHHQDKVSQLIKALPNELGREPFVWKITNSLKKPKKWGPKTIVYYASWGAEHFEGWSPKSLKRGIGGSETAVIELAKRWAKKGYKVTVFGDPRSEAGTYDGVEYRPWYECNLFNDEFNVLILWRSPHLLDMNIKAKKLFMDLHDVASNLDWKPERVARIDKVFFKSKYHRSMVPNIPDSKAVIISNGINI